MTIFRQYLRTLTEQRRLTNERMIPMFKHRLSNREILYIVTLILIALLSITLLSGVLTSPQFHAKTLRVLDEQKNEALALSVSVTAASTALSALPDDMASSISAELADLALPLFLIVSVIYLEIFLLTTFGWITATFLLPAVCLLLVGFVLLRRDFLLIWVKKLFILSLALVLLIPTSATITHHIEETFSETIDQKLHAAAHITDAAEADDEKTDGNAIRSFFSGLADNVSAIIDTARNMLSSMIDAVAVMLITSLIIPIITLLLFMKAVSLALNVDIPTSTLVKLVPPTTRRRLSDLQVRFNAEAVPASSETETKCLKDNDD